MKINQKKLKIIEKILYVVLLFVFYFSVFINVRFNDISFEHLMYNLVNTKGANYEIVFVGVAFIIIRLVITLLVIYILYRIYKKLNIKIFFIIGFDKKEKKIELFKKTKFKSVLYLIIFAIIILYGSSALLNLDEYIKNQLSVSQIFEEYYIDGSSIKIEFPEEKRNLIYIYLESMEATNVSKENGGFVEKSYIPKLERLALENINFSNTDKLGGAIYVNNTGWTSAALIAQTSGVPLKLSIDYNSYKNHGESLLGVYSLGDILEDNGYNNYFMMGSDASFGGRKDYFESHGNYTIYDYIYAKENGMIESDYYVWWGYEDKKLFEFAKEKILEASDKDEPFNFTILTVDTHFTDGYMDNSCKEIFDSKYANSIYCSDSKIYSFINWIKEQDFYENTTIIISGDHFTMQDNFYKNDNDYKRTIYNTFINSVVTPNNEKNRLFSVFDMFPTTLASLGVKIEGNKLGLGVNLFSKEKTLIEELGVEYFNEEIAKKSLYYDNVLLRDTYYEMNVQLKKDTN